MNEEDFREVIKMFSDGCLSSKTMTQIYMGDHYDSYIIDSECIFPLEPEPEKLKTIKDIWDTI